MRILFVIDSLETGGAERILVNLLNNLSTKEEFCITLLTLQNRGALLSQLPESIKHISLLYNNNSSLFTKVFNNILLRLMYILPLHSLHRKIVRDEFDIEVAYLEGLATKFVASSTNQKSKKIAFVHTDLNLNPWSTKNYISLNSEINYYKAFKQVYTVSTEVKESFEKKYSREAKVLLNPIDSKRILKMSSEYRVHSKPEYFTITSVGRMIKEKGFDRLIDAIDKIKDDYGNIRLILIGDGIERSNLEQLSKIRGLDKYISFLGNLENPYPYILNSDLFVSSSFVEGYSTVVCEAVILGVPIVTTDCAGMKDILGDSEYGLIVNNDLESLYNGIRLMIQNKPLYNSYKKKVKERKVYFDGDFRIAEYIKAIKK